ncbi:MAG: hypothetical protein DHS20C12_28130 [Pseudohongiella sp.]|nr:MAG: hypothetical protein DHS20C12_28130 [Pseudohongiella sp.]
MEEQDGEYQTSEQKNSFQILPTPTLNYCEHMFTVSIYDR